MNALPATDSNARVVELYEILENLTEKWADYPDGAPAGRAMETDGAAAIGCIVQIIGTEANSLPALQAKFKLLTWLGVASDNKMALCDELTESLKADLHRKTESGLTNADALMGRPQ